MRGTLSYELFRHGVQGIIPAYAGNTERRFSTGGNIGDHPRVCGEHQAEIIYERLSQGSSPRMRGTRHHMLA